MATATLAGRDVLLADDGIPDGWPSDYEIPTLGLDVLAWAEAMLGQPDGDAAGDSWRWTITQGRLVAWWFAVDDQGRWLYRRGQVVMPKGAGKSPLAAALACCALAGPVVFDGFDAHGGAVGKPQPSPHIQLAAVSEQQPLCLDTPVATLQGWSTIGALEIGDYVFGSDGTPQRVARATDVLLGERCYRVTFDDGEAITASSGHGWTMERLNGHGDRYESVTVTTEEMADTHIGPKGRRRYRMRTARLALPDVELPVDPYFLGLWLGDGAAADSAVAMDARDRAEYEALVKPLMSDIEEVVWHQEPGTNVGKFRIRRRQYICPRGHDYSEAGHFVSKAGHRGCATCRSLKREGRDRIPVIPTMRERLRNAGVLGNKHIPSAYLRSGDDQRLALLQGLVDSDGGVTAKGQAYFVNADTDLFDQVVELVVSLGYRYSVAPGEGSARYLYFTPGIERPVARLARKANRQKPYGIRSRSAHRWVVSVEEVPSVPVRCIGIDANDHLFQVGHRAVLTHNTDNTMSLVLSMLREGDAADEIEGLDLGLSRVRTRTGILQPVTASAAAREGQRLTDAILDEPHLWLDTNGGQRLAATLRRNLGKMGGRSIETTNAWQPGEDSVAEHTALYADKIAEGKAADVGLLRYHPSATVRDLSDIDDLRAALHGLYHDAPWVDVERVIAEVHDLGTHPADARRYYLNEITTADDQLVAPYEWDACRTDERLEPGDTIVLGFDGSLREDATALVACRVSDRLFVPLGIWEKPDGPMGEGWEVDRQAADDAVKLAFEHYHVAAMFADVEHWSSYIDAWSDAWREDLLIKASPNSEIGWDMRGRLQMSTLANERLVAAIADGAVKQTGDTQYRRHVLNARRRPNRYGVSFGKERRHSPRKVDGYAATLLADMARHDLVQSPAWKKHNAGPRKRPGRVMAWG